MFLDFIKEYVEDLIDCSDCMYKISREQKEDVCYKVANNDGIWQEMDRVIYDLLSKYEINEEKEDDK